MIESSIFARRRRDGARSTRSMPMLGLTAFRTRSRGARLRIARAAPSRSILDVY